MDAARAHVITVRVKPRSSGSALEQDATGAWVARLRSAPVDGRANAELIALVAARFGCPRSAVTIRTGRAGRLKRVEITGR
jgi:uncharacterized protein YggU (UPF0235/DUF167 family)